MRIAVIGSGNIGGTLGRAWARAGHDVVFGVRDPQVAGTGSLLEGAPGAGVASVADAARGADTLLLAVPGAALGDVLGNLSAGSAPRVIIDATNNLGGGPMNGVGAIAAAVPDAHVYRAFNTLGWENLAEPTFGGVSADLFFCGPDGDAGARVESLIADVGLRPVRVGDLDQVDVVDAVTRLWFALSRTRGRHVAFKVLEG
jgi:8-hydroxy-5-deazaflavin:NADPH oxidoreductase